jgi:hypothetical protein
MWPLNRQFGAKWQDKSYAIKQVAPESEVLNKTGVTQH